MKTFEDLIQDVQKPGLCHRCGGCVTFCTAINYGALELSEEGIPQFADREKCIECGMCYSICPEIDEFQEETKNLIGWEPPMGRVLETSLARATDPAVRDKATDGGVVTALLLHLFDRGHIDGAIVTRQTGPFQREPWMATTRQEILDAAGFFIDSSHGMDHFGKGYSTFSPSVSEFRSLMQKGLRRVAMVGTPCQIKAVRKIEAMSIVPSDSIRYCLGLFCSGNFIFDDEAKNKLAAAGNFKWENVYKINIKDQFIVKLNTGETKTIPLDQLDFMKRYACRYCPDYASEYADVSFGGIGAQEGWTTVIARTPEGRAIYHDAQAKTLEVYDFKTKSDYPAQIQTQVRDASNRKKRYSEKMHDELVKSRAESTS
jgi:coenzyme F420 hydrogenase subunit beta